MPAGSPLQTQRNPRLSSDSLSTLLGASADPVSAGFRLRELVEGDLDQGPQLLAELAQRREQLAESDAAILGGLIRVIHTLLMRSSAKSDQPLRDLDVSLILLVDSALPLGRGDTGKKK